jgi:hypothetical protein
LQYLLGAAGGWAVDGDDVQAAIAYIAGAEPVPEGVSHARMAASLQTLLVRLVDAAPANWLALFAVLKTAVPA